MDVFGKQKLICIKQTLKILILEKITADAYFKCLRNMQFVNIMNNIE